MDTQTRLSHLWVSLCVAVLLSLHLLPCGRICQTVFFIILVIMAPSHHQQQPSQYLVLSDLLAEVESLREGETSVEEYRALRKKMKALRAVPVCSCGAKCLCSVALRRERKKMNKLEKEMRLLRKDVYKDNNDSVGKELVIVDAKQNKSQPPSTLKLASSQTKHGKGEVTKLNRGIHPHPLTLKPPGEPYKCSGCQELGFGPSYCCQTDSCNYILHEDCANVVADNSIVFHRFFKDSNFVFYKEKPKEMRRGRYCNACGNDVMGFFYHCHSTGKDLHPCCFKLKHSISVIEGHVTFQLSETVPKRCKKCRSKKVENDIKGWSYVYKDHCYHVSCVKTMIIDKWKEGYFCKEDMSLYDPQTQIPLTRKDMMMVQGSKGSGGKMKVFKLAAVALRLVVSVIFGDPSPLILLAVEALSGS